MKIHFKFGVLAAFVLALTCTTSAQNNNATATMTENISNNRSALVHNMALQFAKEYDFITVDYIDIVKHPALANQYKTTAETTVKTTDVIIENGSDFRKFSH